MSLLLGTHDGLYRAEGVPFDSVDRVLDCGRVHRLRRTDDGVLAATAEGLYWAGAGREWIDLKVPRTQVVAVCERSDGELYAGTYPAAVYRGTLDRASETISWTECEAFTAVDDYDRWMDRSPGEDGAQVRTLAVHPDAPDRIVAGVETGGVCLSDDGGDTWSVRNRGVHDDVHHLLALGPGELVAATGNGLYRTTDAGRTWVRVDTDFRDLWFNYFRESIVHEGRVVTSAFGWGPAEGEGVLFEADDQWRLDREPLPVENAFVLCWAVHEGRLVGGTMRTGEWFEQDEPAPVIAERSGEGWAAVGEAPAGVKSLASLA